MSRRLGDERGVTLVELLVVCALLGVVMSGLVDLFVSGMRAQADTQSRVEAQQNVELALGRLEYEARCASAGAVLDSGSGVSLTLPSQCSHASGTVSWCVSGGVLSRYTTSDCTGTGQPYADSIASATFSIPAAASGDLPQLDIDVSSDGAAGASDAFTLDDTITFRNAAPAT